MFNDKEFINEIDRFEITNECEISMKEINAIVNVCKSDDDPLTLAVFLGFQYGCMKAGAKFD